MNAFRHQSQRRGSALLITLGVLVLMTAATTILVGRASTLQLHVKVESSTAIADDLVRAADAAIVYWLATESPHVVLPPAIESPREQVLHDSWIVGDVEHALAITAFDQCGMVSMEQARTGSPLRLTLPDDLLRHVDELQLDEGSKPGLDLISEAARPFPLADASSVTCFGAAAGDDSSADQTSERTLRLGELLATHNSKPARINVNTAPIALIEAALRMSGRSGIEGIVQSRSAGRSAPLPGGAVSRNIGSVDQDVQFVIASDTWSFRIDIRVDVVRQSWWAVYAKGSNQWELVQRLAITN